MATLRIRGWGAGAWKHHTDHDTDPGGRLLGWGGGRQWRMFCPSTEELVERVQGFGDGQYKLFCEDAVPD